jgi:hypothetical protein
MSQAGINPDGTTRKRVDQLERAVFGAECLSPLTAKDTTKKPANSVTFAPSAGLTTATNANAPDQRRTGWNMPSGTESSMQGQKAIKHGPAALANPSTNGNRQGLWATPRSAMASMHPEYGEHWNDKRGGESIATQVWKEQQWGTPAANDANKTPHCEVNSNQAGLAKSVGLELQRQWGTPTARDHKSGRGNEDRQYKELTPMVERTQTGKLNPRWVETLMGLPVGWVMPSCASPATIAQMNSDSSATELCQPQPSELFESCSTKF